MITEETTDVRSPFGGQRDATILAIESSCDETSAAVCRDGKILSNYIANQTVHEQYGGVVPELASRAHLQNIVPVVDVALQQAGVPLHAMDAIAFTQAPGLIDWIVAGRQPVCQIVGACVKQAIDCGAPHAGACISQLDY